MLLTQHQSGRETRWAVDGRFLPRPLSLSTLLGLPKATMLELLQKLIDQISTEHADGPLLAPLDEQHEVWASGVTYLRSQQARQAESEVGDVYTKVYTATRPELFFKAIGWRVIGPNLPIRVRRDSKWNVPEPELVLVVNREGEIVGYTAGNDVSSRSIEGENPLYLPQAKVYNGSCALGPGIVLTEPDTLRDLAVRLTITRQDAKLFDDSVRTSQIKRPLEELVTYLQKELDFPYGGFLMTGTGIVPPDNFNLQPEDTVQISIGELTLINPVGV